MPTCFYKKDIARKIYVGAGGFTLIELLVVIAILGLLAVTVFVNLNPGSNVADSKNVLLVANIANVEKALNLYAVANNGIFPPADAISFQAVGLTPNFLPVYPPDIAYCRAGSTRAYGLFGVLRQSGNFSSLMNQSSVNPACFADWAPLLGALNCKDIFSGLGIYCRQGG